MKYNYIATAVAIGLGLFAAGKQSNQVSASSTITLDHNSRIYTDEYKAAKRVLKTNTRWKVNKVKTVNKKVWYRVGTNNWVAHNLPMTIKLNQKSSIYSNPGIEYTKLHRTLNKNTKWRVSAVSYNSGSIWYKIGAYNWVSPNNVGNSNYKSSYHRLKLIHNTPVYNKVGYSNRKTVGKITGNQIITTSKTVTYDNLQWYQVGKNKWISPALEATRGWIYSKSANKLPILMYHDFQSNAPTNKWELPYNLFSKQMTWLKQAGYTTVNPEQAYYILTTHRRPANKVVWVTMDDGYKIWYTKINSLLKRNKQIATGFSITARIGDSWNLTSNQLKTLNNSNIRMQSHTVDHKEMTKLSFSKQVYESTESNNRLANIVGQSIVEAYPHGDSNSSVHDSASIANYWMALNMGNTRASASQGMYSLSRIGVFPSNSNTHSKFMSLLTH